jgi:hypothetical protein
LILLRKIKKITTHSKCFLAASAAKGSFETASERPFRDGGGTGKLSGLFIQPHFLQGRTPAKGLLSQPHFAAEGGN